VAQFFNCWKDPRNRHRVYSQADERTLRRWHKEYGSHILTWTAQLRSLLLTLFCRQLPIQDMPDNPLEQLQQVVAAFYTGRKRKTLLGLAQVLIFSHLVCPACPRDFPLKW
jgi:hypothetical protein